MQQQAGEHRLWLSAQDGAVRRCCVLLLALPPAQIERLQALQSASLGS
jgi:hypothetical protein